MAVSVSSAFPLGEAALARAEGERARADRSLGACDLGGFPESFLLRWLRDLVGVAS